MPETILLRSNDRSSVIAAFLLGVVTTLLIVAYWIFFPNILLFSFLSLITLIIFLAITILLAKPRYRKLVRTKLEPLAKESKTFVSESKAKKESKRKSRK